jgi:hypothetical protein
LARLSNRINAEALRCIRGSVHDRIPMPTVAEHRALQLENARIDARFWENMRDMHASTAAEYKEMIGAIERTSAKGEKAAADAGERAAAAKDRIARIEKGETVSGGLGRPRTRKELIAPGWNPSDDRHVLRLAALDDFPGAFEEFLARCGDEGLKRQRLFEKRTSTAILRQRLGLSRNRPQ